MHRVDAVGNSPGVRRELVEGIESLPGWRKGVCQKQTETRLKIIGGSRKACRDYNQMMGQDQAWASGRFGRCNGISPKFAKRFIEGIEKLVGNTLRDR
ncbi:hypothetical protein BHE74_00035662 [Ensete ventricosum]|nr:hypothetical protein BHE74_00035662 [Ensete ventricosum]RZR88309.1 hypothetical protein BHM03_00015845 [Ensete ventricosum]